MASIKLENVTKVYSNGQVAVRDISLDIADGELVVLVGPSGSGKSTILRTVAGLETATGGRIFLDDKDVTEVPPRERDLAMVFQNHALYPHQNVRQNLGFGLRMRRERPGQIAERVRKVAGTLGLAGLLDRRPWQLAGGERQRVALGRAIVRQPKAFLLDEPLSNLDTQLRIQMRAELAHLHRQLGATMLYVTHDQEEALTLGDRVAVLREGVLQQVATPLEIYRRPANVFIAGFIGSPSMNFFRCTLHGDGEGPRLECPWFNPKVSGECGAGGSRQNAESSAQSEDSSILPTGFCFLPSSNPSLTSESKEIILGVRPHDVQLAEAAKADAVGRVDVIQPLGSEIVTRVCLFGPNITLQSATSPPIPPLAGEGLGKRTQVTLMLPAETKINLDDKAGILFRRDRLHFFDADTGRGLN